MSGPVFAHPFRLGADGAVVCLEQDSPDGSADVIMSIVSTRKGEHHLAPQFGLNDPVFVGVRPEDITANLAMYYPDDGIFVTGVRATVLDEASQLVRVYFEERS